MTEEQASPTANTAQAPAGWHPDPEMAGTLRYWDGAQWTDHRAPASGQGPQVAGPPATPRKKGIRGWRKMSWVLILWSALILIWAIAGGGSAADDCGDEATQNLQSACEAGTGIGIAIVLFIGFIGFVFLSLIWFMTRPKD